MKYGYHHSVLHTFSINKQSSNVFCLLKFHIFAYYSAFLQKLYVTELVKPVGNNYLATSQHRYLT